ncbi:hypothetical protein QBC35DRAFT_107686 [Podospora australis]|uniref:GRF-type domain-containing protein n=1 Tax=Podospora australis TaxID=1536484 RepID=A0AAN7APB6_9PEZI|nr:hypothetical protein QBC35DRAFT_107686 [Podospora australis]
MGLPGWFDPNAGDNGVWYCYCSFDQPLKAVLRKSTTSRNDGRWFWGCPRYDQTREKKGTCDMFRWESDAIEFEKLVREGKEQGGPPKFPVTPNTSRFYGNPQQQQQHSIQTTPVSQLSPATGQSSILALRGTPSKQAHNKVPDHAPPPTPSVTSTIREGLKSFNMGSDDGTGDNSNDDDSDEAMGNHYATQQTLFTETNTPRQQTAKAALEHSRTVPGRALLPPTPVSEGPNVRNRLLIAAEARQSPTKRRKRTAETVSFHQDLESQVWTMEKEIEELRAVTAKLTKNVEELKEENQGLKEDRRELRMENKEVREDHRVLSEENKELRAHHFARRAAKHNSASQYTVDGGTGALTLYQE